MSAGGQCETLALLVGIKPEAELVHRLINSKSILSACAASDPDRARHFVARMIADGASRCLSFGLAGGLAPDLSAGTIVIADRIRCQSGDYVCDDNWVRHLKAALPQAYVGNIWGHDKIVADPATKQLLHREASCLACDMESHSVAAAAQAAGLPFTALRVVCDPVGFALPPAALLPLKPDGAPDLAAILRDILHRPAQLPALLRLAAHNAAAMRALKRAAAAIA